RRLPCASAAAAAAARAVGSRTLLCCAADAAGRMLARAEAPMQGPDPIAPLVQAVRGTGLAPSAVGVAVPGILDPAGRVSRSLAVPALEGIDIAGTLAERLGCPVEVENDIKLAALAEHHLVPGAEGTVLLQLGHRVSGAVIIDGAIRQGAHRLAGELGSQRGMRWTDSSVRGRLTWSTGDDAQELLERAAAGDLDAVQEIEE